MKGSFFLGDKKFQIRQLEPLPVGDYDVIIRNRACGICGTDIHIYHGEEGSVAVKPPVVLGHEYAGEVIDTGKRVKSVKVGDKVAVDPNIYCGKCHYCKTGKKQLCENLVAIGVNYNGGFAELSTVPERQCFILNDDISFEAGAMAEPLACCIHGIDNAHILSGDSVCVIGGGAIGLLMVQLAKKAGASIVFLSEPIEKRRKIGLQLGADYAIDPVNQSLLEVVEKNTNISGVDVVIECVGKTAATEQAFNVAKRGATILLFSVPSAGASYDLSLFDVFKKELKITGSFINPDTHQRAVNLINSKDISTDEIITHRFKLEQINQAIKAQMSSASIKVMVTL